MAGDTTSWTVNMEDGVTGAATSAADALAKLDDQIQADTKALAGMNRAMKVLQSGSSVNVDAYRKLNAQMVATKARLIENQQQSIALGGSFGKAKSSTGGLVNQLKAIVDKQAAVKPPDKVAEFTKSIDGLQKTVSAVPGPLGQLASWLGRLKALIGGGLVAAILAIAAALVAVTVATIAAGKALYDYGKAQAEARRNELLRLEGLTKLRFMYQRVKGNAKEMQDAIDRVAASTPASRDSIAKYETQLYRMGLRGAALTKTLEAVSIKLAVQGEEAANAFAGWAAGANMSGQGVDRLVNRVKNELGPTARQMMVSSEVQAQKLKESWNALFAGIKMDKYLSAWAEVNDQISQNTAAGRALKSVLTAALQPFYDLSGKGAPLVKRFIQGMVLALLDLAIDVVKLRREFRKTFGEGSLFDGLGEGTAAVVTAKLAFQAFFYVMKTALAPVWDVIKAFLAIYTLLEDAGDIIARVVNWFRLLFKDVSLVSPTLAKALAFLREKLSELWTYITELLGGSAIGRFLLETIDVWVDFGKSIVQGIVKGIRSIAKTDMGHVMKELAMDAVSSFKDFLGIYSPSVVFAQLGKEIPAGVAEGVDDNAPAAQQATEHMVDAAATMPDLGGMPKAGGSLAGGKAAAKSGGKPGGKSVTIEQLNVYAQSNDPKGMAQDIRRELETVLEGLAVEIGAPA